MNYCIKIIVGYRRDQEHSIPAEEAHKAYYLFLHPEARTVFSTGLALKGDQIQEIVPDYQGTMGWSPTHVLDSDDHTDLVRKGVVSGLRNLMTAAKEIGQRADPADLSQTLQELITRKYPQLMTPESREGEMKRLSDFKPNGH